MQNDDNNRPGQPPIHTQLPDSIPPEDAKKIVGDAVPHSADYNDPPPQGASKSMGSGLDDSVGGPGLGQPPVAQGSANNTREEDSRADDQHMGNGGNRQSAQPAGQQQQGQPQQSQSQQSQSGQAPSRKGQQQQQRQPDGQQGNQQGTQSDAGNAQGDTGARSEGLLPDEGETDGRYDVAEEVSLDQQSDQARSVGSLEETAKGPHGDKLAEAVAGSLGKDTGGQKP
ncbi:hypothetical protein IP91_01247 [Pseudoduganella lurida]|uniref:Uncharacterized protein n=1 Tax=Pseudoduganella lurida TaxID=1036180 RepID=A0A562RM97_9BURK|nr:hypothetical protein [Pseudoduganella lurida]TWI70167.1 hypothetical protein IP91_01247 [Pseudoduganella lurida]